MKRRAAGGLVAALVAVAAVSLIVVAGPRPAAAVGGTDTDVTGSPNPSTEGQAVLITAKVTADAPPGPVGAVFFFDGDLTKPIGTGAPLVPQTGCFPVVICNYSVAQISTSELSVGTHTIIAVFPVGVSPDLPSSGRYTQVVTAKAKGRTATRLASAPNPSQQGQAVIFTASVAVVTPGGPAPTGMVQLYDFGAPLGVAQSIDASGRVSFVMPGLSPGIHSVSAVYSGDTDYLPSESNVVIQVVRAPVADIGVTKSCGPAIVVPGDVVTCTVTVTNWGPDEASSVSVNDFLPAEMAVASAPTGGGFGCEATVGSSTLSCRKASQPVGPGSTFTYTATVASEIPPGTPLTNRVTANSPLVDPQRANNAASATVTTVSCGLTGSGDILGTPGDDVICGSDGPDRIAGIGGNDVIYGGGGNDQLIGGDGNDRLLGGDGDDRLSGGTGDDVMFGNAGTDYIAGGGGVDHCSAEHSASCEG